MHRRGIELASQHRLVARKLLIRTHYLNSVLLDGLNATSKFLVLGDFFQGWSMLRDRRETVRYVVNRPAKLLESPAMRECTIRDISSTGVKLVVSGGLASDQFSLFDGEAVEHRCLVIWRLGELVGARFAK